MSPGHPAGQPRIGESKPGPCTGNTHTSRCRAARHSRAVTSEARAAGVITLTKNPTRSSAVSIWRHQPTPPSISGRSCHTGRLGRSWLAACGVRWRRLRRRSGHRRGTPHGGLRWSGGGTAAGGAVAVWGAAGCRRWAGSDWWESSSGLREVGGRNTLSGLFSSVPMARCAANGWLGVRVDGWARLAGRQCWEVAWRAGGYGQQGAISMLNRWVVRRCTAARAT